MVQADEDSAAVKGKSHLTTSWYSWDPYIYSKDLQGIEVWTGLDVKVMDAVFKRAGLHYVANKETDWADIVEDIREGNTDFGIAAFVTPEREKFAYFSKPYREEYVALFIPRDRAHAFKFQDLDDLFALFHKEGWRLGVSKGWSYSAKLDPYLQDPVNQSILVKFANQEQLVQALLKKEVDAYLNYRISGQTLLWRGKFQNRIQEHPKILFGSSVYTMFSKKTVPLETIERFNHALDDLLASGDYSKIVRHYLFPILLSMTVQTHWFFVIDVIGIIAFSISGILLGYKERYSLFGTFFLAALPALGGGAIRDIFVGRHPLGVLRTPRNVEIVIATVLVSFVFLRFIGWLERRQPVFHRWVSRRLEFSQRILVNQVVGICDALGLAAFTVVGVVVAVEAQVEPLWLWAPFLAVLTGGGGGIVRDMIRNESEIKNLKSEFYLEVALIWGFILACYLTWSTSRLNPQEIFLVVVAMVVGGFLTRLVAMWFKIKSPLLNVRKNQD